MRKTVFIILLVCLSSIYYFSLENNENTYIHSKIVKVKDIVSNYTKLTLTQKVEVNQSQQVLADSTNGANDNELDFSKYTDEKLNQWINTESSIMNSTNHNTDRKRIQLKAQAQTLSLMQLQTLKNDTVNTEKPANARILSAYLITLNASEESGGVLLELAGSSVPNHGPSVPHSEAELKNAQELALRYMAIDELFLRAKTDSKAYDQIKLIYETASSAQVRNYAENKLKQLKN